MAIPMIMGTGMTIIMGMIIGHAPRCRKPHDHGIWTRDHVFLGAGHGRAEASAKWRRWSPPCSWWWRSAAGLPITPWRCWPMACIWRPMSARWAWRPAPIGWRGAMPASGRFTFGSGKFGDLAAFSSAIILGITALVVAMESIERLITPPPVAIWRCAADRLHRACVNLVSALILKDSHHGHAHGHGDDHGHAHAGSGDNNMRAAYVHVLADAATSVLAIVALACGYFFGLGLSGSRERPGRRLCHRLLVLWPDPRQRHGAAGCRCRSGHVGAIKPHDRRRDGRARRRPASVAAGAGPSRA